MKYKLLADLYQKIEGTSKRLEKTFYLSEFLKKVDVKDLDKLVLLFQGRVFPPWDERKIGVAAKLVLVKYFSAPRPIFQAVDGTRPGFPRSMIFFLFFTLSTGTNKLKGGRDICREISAFRIRSPESEYFACRDGFRLKYFRFPCLKSAVL